MQTPQIPTQSIFENRIVIGLISLLGGAVIKSIFDKIQNKTSVFTYSTRSDRIALASDDPIFGSVRITWQGNDVHNLYTSTVEIENTSTRDFDNIVFKLYTTNDIFLLNQRTGIDGTPYAIAWSSEFQEALKVPEGQLATEEQWKLYNHSREFIVPVFNRGQKLSFSMLCTRPNSVEPPLVFASTLLKGAKLQLKIKNNIFWNVPNNSALFRGLFITLTLALISGIATNNRWIGISIGTFAGLTAVLLGAALYKVEQWLKKLIAG